MQWNFTGWIVGWHKESGEIVAKYAMEGGTERSGIGGGIWMSGGGISSDNPGRMFFATGNGYASQLADDPVPGRSPPTALEEAVVNMAINDDGSVVPVDFFMPWEKRDLDAMDKDLGTSGFVLLDPATFGTDSVRRIGCVAGKTGKLYFLNLEDLGGYQMGPDRKDKVLQTVQMSAPVFASAGSYPLEGGYVYVSPVGKETVAFRFGKTADGMPVFTQAGLTTHSAAGRQGVGHGTVTSMNGEPGTGILWLVDVEGVNVRAYGAVPEDGKLPTLLMVNNPGQSKFSRPTFGNGKVYLTTTSGVITALGSPVNMPLNCSSPYDAGTALIGNQTTTEITCVSKIPLTINAIDLDSATHFSLLDVPTLPAQLVQGATFKFKAVFKPTAVGPLSTTMNIRTANGGGQPYAINTPIVIRGTARSLAPILVIEPNVLSFGEIITGSNETGTLDFGLQNTGEGELTVRSYKWSTQDPDGPYLDGDAAPVPAADGSYTVGPFQLRGLPAIGGKVPGNDRALASVRFAPTQDGYFKLYLVIATDGGTKNVGAFGTAGAAPVAFFEWKTKSGEWIPYLEGTPFKFEDVLLGSQDVMTMRLTNKGGTTLTTTISKPPVTGPLAALNGLGSIAEGSQLSPGESEEAQLVCAPPKGQVNKDPLPLEAIWTINNNDPVMGKQVIHFSCSGISVQLGPLQSDGSGRYRYVGCYKDADPQRRMDELLYYSQENENGKCMNDCFAKGYIFAATQYEGECWCGNKPAVQLFPDTTCQYLCRGDFRQYCGGDGAYMSMFADEEKWNPGNPPASSSTITATSTTTRTASVPLATGTTTTTTTSSTTTPTLRPEYVYLGCANEGNNGRALAKDGYASSDMTTDTCQDYCTTKGYPLSGTEYSQECFCGNTLEHGSVLGGSTACVMPCGGNPNLICGGPSALSVYNNTARALPREPGEVPNVEEYLSIGCWTEGTTGRALAGASIVLSNMTVEYCVGYCSAAGFAYAGLEYSAECHCGQTIGNGAMKATEGCNMLCAGDKFAFCGGVGRLNVYAKDGAASSPPSPSPTAPTQSAGTSPPSTTTSSTSSPSTTSSSTSTSAPSTWTYLGCASEPPSSRALTGPSTSSPSMTPHLCHTFCSTQNYPLSGIEYGTECYCSLTLHPISNSTFPTPPTDCSMPCPGFSPPIQNPTPAQLCGGPNRLSLWSDTAFVRPKVVRDVGGFVSLACYTDPDSSGQRTLPDGHAFGDDALTVEMCVGECKTRGFRYAGVEYARECYCAAGLSVLATRVDAAQCDMVCAGNKGEYCGGVGRILVYEEDSG